MTTAAKATIAAGSVGGGALGGAALGGAFSSDSPKQPTTSTTKPQDKDISKTVTPPAPIGKPEVKEVFWSSLSLEMTNPDNTYNGKIGSVYKHLLTGAYGPTGNSTEKWWNQKLEKYNADKNSNPNNFSTEFGKDKVTSAFAKQSAKNNDPDKALNRVCDSIYRREISDITPTVNQQDNQSKLKEDLWKYCSNLETSPKTIKEAPIENHTYNAEEYGLTKQSELLSVKEGVNKILWNLKQKEFFSLEKVDDDFFQELYKKKGSNISETALKDKCKDAYSKKTADAANSPSDTNTVKYCSAKAIT